MRRDLALEQKFLRTWKGVKTPPRKLLLALSGGVDSMVMAEILCKWSRGLKLELAVAYVHHGPSERPAQARYRSEAQAFVHAWAKAHSFKFFTNARAPKLKSESEMREFREEKLRAWAEKFGAQAIAFAHHEDDLLETRMIRLIRGSGRQGMYAMGFARGGKLRPLLSFSREEILEYARLRGLAWVEDPSNEHVDVLRNWLRREWLPSLEKQRPGSLKTLARSLAHVSPAPKSQEEFDMAPYVGLRRELFAAGPTRQSREVLAQYLKSLGLKGYAQTHVDEILKRLASERENLAFEMLGMRFQVSSRFLWASRV